MVACKKREQAVSEKKRKNFSGQFKTKVALEAIRGVKTANVLIAFLVSGTIPRKDRYDVGAWGQQLS